MELVRDHERAVDAVLAAIRARSWRAIADAQRDVRAPGAVTEAALAAGTDADRAWFDRQARREATR